MGGAAPAARRRCPGVQIADLAGGALWGATGVLGALVGRERTGRGAHLDISMTEGALALLAAELGNLDSGAALRPAARATLNGGLACYGVYRTSDGKLPRRSARSSPSSGSRSTARSAAREDLTELVAPPERQAQVRGEVQAILATRTRDEWAELLAAHDCCCEPVLEIDELRGHPLHAARGVFTDVPSATPASRARPCCRCARRPARRGPIAWPRASASTAARSWPSTASPRPRSARCVA